jgi:GntR family transcriptional regulator / MocR family aminotransferase
MQPATARSSPRSAMPPQRYKVTGVDAGLHLVANLPPGSSETAAQQRLHHAGLAIDVLSQYATTAITQQALVCSYALLPETQARAAAAVIASHTPEPTQPPIVRH